MISSFPSDAVAFVGLSTDTKPITKYLKNGSLYLEMDTGKVFIFDEENAKWLELGGDIPTPPVPPIDPTVLYDHYIYWDGYFRIEDNTVEKGFRDSGEYTGVLQLRTDNEAPITSFEELYVAWINSHTGARVSLYCQNPDDENQYVKHNNYLDTMIPNQPDDGNLSLIFSAELPLEGWNSSTQSCWIVVQSFEDYNNIEDLPQAVDELVYHGE